MAREYGAFYYSAWNDHEFRMLPDPAQALYMKLVVHPSLSWAGVGDWRPGRIATMSQGMDAADVRLVANCLIARHYIVVDDDTEEFLIRTYIKHDGIMRHAKLCVSMANAFGAVGSNTIRMILSDELHKLREAEPDAVGWKREAVLQCLETPRLDAHTMAVPSDPFSSGFRYGFSNSFSSAVSSQDALIDPCVKESVKECPTPAPAPAPLAPAPEGAPAPQTTAPNGARITENWTPTERLLAWAAENTPDIDLDVQTDNFRDYWLSKSGKDATKLDWGRTWQRWMRTEQERASRRPTRTHQASYAGLTEWERP